MVVTRRTKIAFSTTRQTQPTASCRGLNLSRTEFSQPVRFQCIAEPLVKRCSMLPKTHSQIPIMFAVPWTG